MSDFIENIWSQFGMETQEHIEEIELKLVETERSGATSEHVASLFRAFHSLKGLAIAMDLNSFARLAHRAEDILGVIREGAFPLNSDVISLLLDALDEIKVLRRSVVALHSNAEADSQLMEHLAETFSSMEQTVVTREISCETDSATTQHTDPEILSYFFELSREKTAAISCALGILTSELKKATEQEVEELVARVATEIDQLAYAAEAMDFLDLVKILHQLRSALIARSTRDYELPVSLAARLLELHDQLRVIESMCGNSDAGSNTVHTFLGDTVPLNHQAAPAAAADGSTHNAIRIKGESLDNFMNQIGELTLVRSRLNHIIHDDRLHMLITCLKHLKNSNSQDASELLCLAEEHRRELVETDHLLHNSLGRLQEGAVRLRVVPVDMVFKRLPRVVHDLSRSMGKEIRLEVNGQDVKIDKAMVEILMDPLLHMVRNSVDHGIEMPAARTAAGKHTEAVIRVSAIQFGNRIVIEVSDDGAGIDMEKVMLKAVEHGLVMGSRAKPLSKKELLHIIFQPGFSTATGVTETSGRGVGLDVVMNNVTRMGGTLSVDSEHGCGTTFTLHMPLSVAIQDVLLVEASGQTLALPERNVSEVLDVAAEDLLSVRGERGTLLRGAFLSLHRLSDLLGYPASVTTQNSGGSAVVVTNGTDIIGLEVDRVVRREELFVKIVHESVVTLPGVGGASILGNGRVVLILDGEDLLRIARA